MKGIKVSSKVQENIAFTLNDRTDLVLCISLCIENDIEIHLYLDLDLGSNLLSASSPVYYLFPNLIILKCYSTQNMLDHF